MQTNLLGRMVSLTLTNDKAEIVAVEMKQSGGANCFLVLTLLLPDGSLKTHPERDVVVEEVS